MSDFNPYQPSQPQNPYGASMTPQKPMMQKPKNYMGEAIFLLLCCCGFFAIPAIVYAAQVDAKYNAGDDSGAMQSSDNAKNWCLIGLCIGLFCNTIVGVLQFTIDNNVQQL